MSDGQVGARVRKASPPPNNNPAAMPPDKKDFASTHRVKKLLETYSMRAESSLMGPDASGGLDEDLQAAAGKYYGGYSANAYKLPPDVELSKTSPVENVRRSSSSDKEHQHQLPARVDSIAASKRLQMVAALGGLKGGAASPPPPTGGLSSRSHPGSSTATTTNGLVTLSRIDGNGYDAAEYARHRSRSGSTDPRHLTGEMIRQMNALQKKGSGNASAAAVAAASMAYQHQMQMHATYERVLKEKSYLKYNKLAAAAEQQPHSTFKAPSSASATTTSSALAPVFSARDRGQANLTETKLANRDIACFDVGGEKRCCLPQILNSVLDQISLAAIHAACDELQIYCSTCTPEQLEVLKVTKIIPNTASQCGLITKSDAERLCSILLDRNPPIASMMGFHATASPFSFRVQHECFGKCRGIVLPEAYTSGTAKCIECLECEGLFCPAKFVCHSHRNKENRTCHWGFDSANWRAYLHLADDYTDTERDKLNKTVRDFKSRYSSTSSASASATAIKRKPEQQQQQPQTSYHHNGGRERSLEAKSPRHPVEPPKKAARMAEADPNYPPSAMFPAGDAYGLYLYQTWAAAAATGGKAPPPMHPAAAWANHYAQSIKEGKAPPMAPPGYPQAMAPPRPSSSTGHNGGGYHRSGYEGKLVSPHHPRMSPSEVRHHPVVRDGDRAVHHGGPIKSSPMSDNGGSPSERLTHSIESTATSPGEVVSASHLRRSKSSTSFSLTEDIVAIRSALEGATVAARERTLKTLERLTARLAMAESDRDIALDQLKKLQRRYEMTDDELHKKRAELREALRNDSVTSVSASSPVTHLPPPQHGHHQQQQHRGDNGNGNGNGNSQARSIITASLEGDHDDPFQASKRVDYLSKKYGSLLPKMDMKSPARVIEEKEQSSAGSSRSSRSSQPTGSPPPTVAALSADVDSTNTSDSILPIRTHLRRRSGTPASMRSRESEDLRERMMTMEAELRALRDELSNRSSMVVKDDVKDDVAKSEPADDQAASAADEASKSIKTEAIVNNDKKDPISTIDDEDEPVAKKSKTENDDDIESSSSSAAENYS